MRQSFVYHFIIFIVAIINIQTVTVALAVEQQVTIGVLAYRGTQRSLQRWQATAEYLSTNIPGYQFIINPLNLQAMRDAIERNHLDFVLTNPGHYVSLETTYGVTRLLTLNNLRVGKGVNEFAAVMFTHKRNQSIQTLMDVKNKSMMAVSADAFGGFQLARYELEKQGIDPYYDMKLVFNGFPQDDIVYAVLDGKIDVGTVRADILSRMYAEDLIDIKDFRILNSQFSPDYPFKHSTQLYPEWPFSRARHTEDALSQQVAIALLTMKSTTAAAIKGKYIGWNVPSDYRKVHQVFRYLKIAPYNTNPSFQTLLAGDTSYLTITLSLLVLMMVITIVLMVYLFKYKKSKNRLIQEIKQRKKIQIILSKLSRALEQTNETIMITNREGTIEYVNAAFERLTGFSVQEAIGFTPAILKSDQHEDAFYSDMWRSISAGRVFKGVLINRCRDGSLMYEEKTITPLRDNSGKIIHFIATGNDITERQNASRLQEEHDQQLAHVSRVSMMGEMASSIAHELNQPLAAIANYAQGCIRRMSSSEYNPNQIIGALENISNQSKRSGDIIRRLRDFVRKGEPNRASIDINSVIQAAVGLANFEARKRGVYVHFQLQKILPMVLADDIQIEQVVLNLVRNAYEAMDGNSWNRKEIIIHSWYNLSLDMVEVAVWDTGHGISNEQHENLFDAFFSTKKDGMGIGLAISRSIIESHGGHLTANINQVRGTTFRFSLPVAVTSSEALHG